MPRPRKATTQGKERPAQPPTGQENISGYFRKLFAENPKLLKTRSNQEVLERWLTDHPGKRKVPERVKQSLSNVKSILRKKLRKRGRKAAATEAASAVESVPQLQVVPLGLEALEIQIDDVLTVARTLDREGLESVINHLRRARNEVVWKLGQPE
ncbi:MAG TPA: hypothetical protein VGY58_12915 [Gemmataceae bacterium]|nr:hypothetical protein [Gemmataceae bacterium]